MISRDIAQAFLSREPIVGVAYRHNDLVLVIAGPYHGRHASLVSLLALAPEPLFLLELGEGVESGDVECWQSQLRFIAHDDA